MQLQCLNSLNLEIISLKDLQKDINLGLFLVTLVKGFKSAAGKRKLRNI